MHRFAVDRVSKKNRSAVTNGRRTFIEADGRTVWARRARDLMTLHISDLGGPDRLSEAQLSLVRRASSIEVELERMESRLAKGEEVDLGLYQSLTATLRRILESLGLNRVARDVTPTLSRILAEGAQEAAGKPTGARRAAPPVIDAEAEEAAE